MKCVKCKKFCKLGNSSVCRQCSWKRVGSTYYGKRTINNANNSAHTSEEISEAPAQVPVEQSTTNYFESDTQSTNATNEQHEENAVPLLTCRNCRRQQTRNNNLQSHSVYRLSVRMHNIINSRKPGWNRRKFHLLGRLPRHENIIALCQQCNTYITNEASDNKGELVWPAFLWSVLSRPDCVQFAWLLLPEIWKPWWENAIVLHHGLSSAMLSSAASLFNEVSYDLELDQKALKSLKWVDLKAREESLVLPLVRCPAGCSEFKHKSNSLPLDLMFQECLQVKLLKLYSNRSSDRFKRMIREDYLVAPLLLNNPKWMCSPCIARDKGVPTVLSCRKHSILSVHQIIHPPRNPLGSLSTQMAGGLSPVTVVPRTISTAQASTYSASFHMSRMQGSYHGLDTMYLTTRRDLQSNCTNLAWQHDVLSYASRKDIRASARTNLRDRSSLQELESDAQELYPFLRELKDRFSQGATTISLEKAVELHTDNNFAPAQTGIIHENNNTLTTVQYQPKWCENIIWAQPANSSFGCRPPTVADFKSSTVDTRLAWIVSCMLLSVERLWKMVADLNPKHNTSWEGWLLTILTTKCLPHVKKRGTKSPFGKKMNEEKFAQKFMCSTTHPGNYNISMLNTLFTNVISAGSSVIVDCNELHINDYPPNTKVVILFRDYNNTDAGDSNNMSWIPPLQHGKHFSENSCTVQIWKSIVFI